MTLHAYTSRAVVLSKKRHHCDDQDLLSLLCAFLSVAPRYRKFGKDGKSLLCQSKSKLHTYIFTFSYTHASAFPFLYKINVHFQPDNRQPLCVISTQHVLKLHSLHLHILCLLCTKLVSRRHQKIGSRFFLLLHIILQKKTIILISSSWTTPHHTHLMSSSLKNFILP